MYWSNCSPALNHQYLLYLNVLHDNIHMSEMITDINKDKTPDTDSIYLILPVWCKAQVS